MKKIQEKPFTTVIVEGHSRDLHFGEAHSTSSKHDYVKLAGDEFVPFDGHRKCIKIELEENNYLKESYLSGDEVRENCTVKVFINGVQVYEDWHRTYGQAYKKAEHFIEKVEDLDWFPLQTESKVGTKVGYREQIFRISSFCIDQGCMILETLDGKPRKAFISENDPEWDDPSDIDNSLKVEITDPAIWWWVNQDISSFTNNT